MYEHVTLQSDGDYAESNSGRCDRGILSEPAKFIEWGLFHYPESVFRNQCVIHVSIQKSTISLIAMGQVLSSFFCGSLGKDEVVINPSIRDSRQFIFVEEVEVPATILGESPHWCSITDSLFYIDITGKTIYQYIPSSNSSNSMVMDSVVGFAVPTNESTPENIILFVGLESEVIEVNFSTKEILHVISTITGVPTDGCRFNDGKCNAAGRLYAGYMNKNWRDGIRGNVFQLIKSNHEPGLDDEVDHFQLEAMFDSDQFLLPNGLVWTKNCCYYIDSGNNTITSYIEVPNNESSSCTHIMKKTGIIFVLNYDDASNGYMLDGMTVDSEGMLWVRFFFLLILLNYLRSNLKNHQFLMFLTDMIACKLIE